MPSPATPPQLDDGGGAGLLGGPELIVWILLALGAAMVVGSVGALVRPPARTKDGELERAPVARSVAMAVLGGIVTVWALASILT